MVVARSDFYPREFSVDGSSFHRYRRSESLIINCFSAELFVRGDSEADFACLRQVETEQSGGAICSQREVSQWSEES